jgi:hypothetical protein
MAIGSLAWLLAVALPARAEIDVVQVVRDAPGGLSGARAVAVSPDGFDVYLGYYEDALAHFHRGSFLEPWRFRGALVNGVGGIEGLDSPSAIAVAPNGLYVYVTAQGAPGSLATFEREPSTGALEPTSDADHVYVASGFDAAVAILTYDFFCDDDLGYVGKASTLSVPVVSLRSAIGVSAPVEGLRA